MISLQHVPLTTVWRMAWRGGAHLPEPDSHVQERSYRLSKSPFSWNVTVTWMNDRRTNSSFRHGYLVDIYLYLMNKMSLVL